MAIKKLTKRIVVAINKQKYDLLVINLPNADSLGHTGNMQAAKVGLEYIDASLKTIVEEAISEYTILITADHGNCEYMKDKQSQDNRKEDTTSAVPLIIIDQELEGKGGATYIDLASLPPTAVLSDVASTIIAILQLPPNSNMNGIDLIKEAIIT